MGKNKIVVMGFVMTIILHTTGCGSQIPDMTEEQSAAISEYAVELLLKYNAGDDSRLVDLSLLEQEPEPTKQPQPTPIPTKAPTGMDEVTDTPVVEKNEMEILDGSDIKMALGLAESVSFEYVGCQLVDEYVDQAVEELKIEAETGNKLMICEFVLMNDGAEKQSVDMLRDNIKYVLNVDGKAIPCSVTMLSNDLSTYLGILDADESRKVVVVTEEEAEFLINAKDIYFEVQRGEFIAAIPIK